MNILRFIIPKSATLYLELDSTVRQAIEKMRYHRYTAIPVLDDEGHYVGTLRNDDVLRYILDNGELDLKEAEQDGITSILDREYSRPIYHNATVNELIDEVKEHNFVPVVDDRGCFIGIILRRDVLNYLLKYYVEQDHTDN